MLLLVAAATRVRAAPAIIAPTVAAPIKDTTATLTRAATESGLRAARSTRSARFIMLGTLVSSTSTTHR